MKKKYIYNVHIGGVKDTKIVVIANNSKKAETRVREIAKEDLPNPNNETMFVLQLISIQELTKPKK